jgi:hypothetical protein
MLRPLYSGKQTLVPIDQEAVFDPELVWTLGEEETLLPLPEFELRIVQHIASILYCLVALQPEILSSTYESCDE